MKSNKGPAPLGWHCQEDHVWNVLSASTLHCLRLSVAAISVKHTGVALCSEHQQDEGCLVTCWRVSSGHPGVEGSRRVSSRSEVERRLLLSRRNARHHIYSSAAGIAVCDVYHGRSPGSTASLEGAQKRRGWSSTAAVQEARQELPTRGEVALLFGPPRPQQRKVSPARHLPEGLQQQITGCIY